MLSCFSIAVHPPHSAENSVHVGLAITVFGRPFVKRFALCYQSVCLSVTLIYCGQTVGRIKMKLGMQVGLGPGHPVPHPPKGADCGATQFLAHICCGQMAAWIKMPLGMELGLGQGDFVLDGDSAPPLQKGAEPPSPPKNCGPCLLWPNGWMDEDGTWHGDRPQPKRTTNCICIASIMVKQLYYSHRQ